MRKLWVLNQKVNITRETIIEWVLEAWQDNNEELIEKRF